MKLTFNCCLCEEQVEVDVAIPEGWESRYESMDEDDVFCPKHAKIAAFAESQCPGCVGGWGDCSMWTAFAYSGRQRDVGQRDFDALERGICPRRTNGTLSVNTRSGSIENLDLSKRAPPEAGAAFAQAIKDYCERYPNAA